MSRWREAACACVLVASGLDPADAQGVVEDLYLTVESLDGTESEVREPRRVTVVLTSDVLFATDKADLSSRARDRLRAVADQIKAEEAGGTVRIAGHTDDRASDAYNLRLSNRRAQAVRTALSTLLAGRGLDLQAKGYGESRPRASGTDDASRTKNRRVEISYGVKAS
ncbi:OmpA family protein [Nonomuraea sp. M3C6]|uniref:OmpA family protein n=1 Tax=Nonomuraea marmarensis TaxID=3351344 RepID=A0ABW7A5H2_9ACTN